MVVHSHDDSYQSSMCLHYKHDVAQFRGIALLNVQRKIFTVRARHMTRSFLSNNYIDSCCQKAQVPGFAGGLEHSTMVCEQNRTAKGQNQIFVFGWIWQMQMALSHMSSSPLPSASSIFQPVSRTWCLLSSATSTFATPLRNMACEV